MDERRAICVGPRAVSRANRPIFFTGFVEGGLGIWPGYEGVKIGSYNLEILLRSGSRNGISPLRDRVQGHQLRLSLSFSNLCW